jgi:hypothetical protein
MGAVASPLRLGMAGLVHGHAVGFLARYRDRKDIELVGIAEPDRAVATRYVQQSRLDPATTHRSLDAMLDRARPQAVVVFTTTADHPAAFAACARRKIPVMMEKLLDVGGRAGPCHRAFGRRERHPRPGQLRDDLVSGGPRRVRRGPGGQGPPAGPAPKTVLHQRASV